MQRACRSRDASPQHENADGFRQPKNPQNATNQKEVECVGAAMRKGAVAVIADQGRLLVIRRAAGVAAPLKLCFPGGGVEPGETDDAAVVREMREELNLSVDLVKRLYESVTPWGVRLSWWSVRCADLSTLAPNEAEVAEVHWLTPDELTAHPDLLDGNIEFLLRLTAAEFTLD
jgi:8-oxo-dGTP diphosphatase